jgi:predicted lipid-binding transport protein (Tim44 family)
MRVTPHGANRDNIHLADTVSGLSVSHGIRRMKNPLAVAIVALSFAPSCVLGQERAGDAALGALSGAVVLGPVGAVAGAVIGFTAGPAISHSWGARGPEPQRRENSPKRPASAGSNGAPAQSANGRAPAPQPAATEKVQQPAAAPQEPAATEKPAPARPLGPEAGNSMPPVQTLE